MHLLLGLCFGSSVSLESIDVSVGQFKCTCFSMFIYIYLYYLQSMTVTFQFLKKKMVKSRTIN